MSAVACKDIERIRLIYLIFYLNIDFVSWFWTKIVGDCFES